MTDGFVHYWQHTLLWQLPKATAPIVDAFDFSPFKKRFAGAIVCGAQSRLRPKGYFPALESAGKNSHNLNSGNLIRSSSRAA